VRFRILCGMALAAVVGILLPTGPVQGSGFWWGPKKHTCFPSCSPSFGYTPTIWSPWPVPGPADASLPGCDGPTPAAPSLTIPRLLPTVAPGVQPGLSGTSAPAGMHESPRRSSSPSSP